MFLKFLGRKNKEKGAVAPKSSRIQDGVDLDMKYCPSCGDEYRPTLTECAVCGAVLISGDEKHAGVAAHKVALAARNMKIAQDEKLVAIRKGSVNDLKNLQKILAGSGVPSLLASDSESCGKGCCGPELFLQIREVDADTATEILAKDFIRSTALDSHDLSNAAAVIDVQASQTTCPACGCKFSPTVGACPECGLCFE